MSAKELSAFFERLQADPALQEKARAVAAAADREEALRALAAGEGFTFSVEELRTAQQAGALAELDDASLREVVGGACGIAGAIAGQPIPMG